MKRKIDLITITAGVMVVVMLMAAFIIVPDKNFSHKENRSLSTAPKFSVKGLFSGEYTSDLAEYISDQFVLRDEFVAVKAYCELIQGKCENNGVIYAENDTLIAKNVITENVMQQNLETVKQFEKQTGVSVFLGILPRSVDVFAERLPDTYPNQNNDILWQKLYASANTLKITAPNLYEPLCEGNNYYRTDHHYTSMGAYQTYRLLGDTIGYKAKSTDFFEQEIVSRDFCGTSMRTSGFYFAKKDKITLFRYDDDNTYKITADGKNINLYDMSSLKNTDQYAVFLGGNHARVDITRNDKNRQKLLVVRDSFADSLAPFLAIHYDLIMLDLRYYTESAAQLVKDEKIEKVLILESIDEFATSKNISYLRKGLQ
ncbi:MAG: DHHW family protein [Clostridia bacterium]|nr:DHHW family protein [Clostridia bacterium]